jgi:chemotaxis protein MotD
LTALRIDTSADTAVPVAGLAVEIVSRAQDGLHRFDIRLDPPELGRIDVRLDVDRDGNVTSRLVVERVETLDLLRRDAPNLERAFQQAGLKTSDQGLQFSLRDQAFSGRDNDANTPAMARIVLADDIEPIETQRHYGRLAGLGNGVDIRV